MKRKNVLSLSYATISVCMYIVYANEVIVLSQQDNKNSGCLALSQTSANSGTKKKIMITK